MSPGKAAAQTAHAARLSLLHYLHDNPAHSVAFLAENSVGSLVTLVAPDLNQLEYLATMAEARCLPWALFVDSEHVILPHFDGTPIATALAIGPAERGLIKPLVRTYPTL